MKGAKREGKREEKSTQPILPFHADKVLLAQTDTTVGFLSQNADSLAFIKERPQHKHFLKVYADWKNFKASYGRIPKAHRSRVRRSDKTTYIVKNNAFRVIHEPHHHDLIKSYGWLFSTSANQSGHKYEQNFCEASADVIIEDFRGLHENPPSSIIRLGKHKAKRVR